MLFDLKVTDGPRQIDRNNVHLAVVERLDRIIELLEGLNASETQASLRTEQKDEPNVGA